MNRGTVDLSGRTCILNEDFKVFLPDNGGGAGPAQDWYTQPLTASPFGNETWDQALTNPGGLPFTLGPDGLTITASKDASGRWHSGLINSCSPDGSKGLLLPPYCYVEATLQLPDAASKQSVAGASPVFWLNSVPPPGFVGGAYGTLEIDVMEAPNDNPLIIQSTVHTWNIPSPTAAGCTPQFAANELMAGFHTYHVDVAPDFVSFGLDGQWFWKTPRPAVPAIPFSLMIGLGVGDGGWPVPTVPGPITMGVKSVKVYR